MSNTKKPRRILLPLLLATGMLTAGAGTGYWLFRTSNEPLSEAAQQDLDAGFEAAQANNTLGSTVADTVEPDAPQVPELPTESRYGDLDLPPLDSVAAAPMDLPPVDQLAMDTSDDELTEEPRDASEVVARGQSPFGDLPPIEVPSAENPLRSRSFDLADSEMLDASNSSEAAAAFADAPLEPAPLPLPVEQAPVELTEIPSEPIDMQGGNPLRAAPAPAPEPAPVAIEAPAPMPNGFTAMAIDEPAPMPQPVANPMPEPAPFRQPEPMGLSAMPVQEPAASGFDAPAPRAMQELAPAEPMRTASLEPTPMAMPSAVATSEGTGRPGERALEGAQQPTLVLQKFAPQEIQVGKECKFVIKVRNSGQRPAADVMVTDEVPQGTQYLGATPQAENLGGKIAWQLGTLSPGEERTMEVDLLPTEEGEVGSVAQVTFSSHASAKSRCTRPQLALRMSAPSQVLIGRQQRINIEIHNPGTGDATGVVLLENVPENVRHQAGPALEFEVGTLRAGETRRLELLLTAEKAGRVNNLLTARADGNLQVQQEVDFDVISPALAVTVDGPQRRYLERPATYTVSVDNPGTAPAKDVQLVTKLPRGMKFVRANNLGEYDATTHSVYWSLAELPEGQKGSVELVAMPIQSGDHTIEVEGRAREGLEDRTSQPVRVEGLAAIMFEVRDAQDPIEVGGTTSYEIRVVNQGSKAATNVQVVAQVPPGMAVTNAQGETQHAVRPEGVIFAPVARLAPKAETTFRIDVQGVRPGDQRIAVEVRTDDIPTPIRKEESTRVFGDE